MSKTTTARWRRRCELKAKGRFGPNGKAMHISAKKTEILVRKSKQL
jgi:hypothetical protein